MGATLRTWGRRRAAAAWRVGGRQAVRGRPRAASKRGPHGGDCDQAHDEQEKHVQAAGDMACIHGTAHAAGGGPPTTTPPRSADVLQPTR
jgi:hypothetical protein